MRVYVRWAVLPAAMLGALLTGCSSADEPAEPTDVAVSEVAPETTSATPTSADPSSSAPVPSAGVGETVTFDTGETDEYGENYQVTSKLSVTVDSVEYVTPEEINTTNEPDLGQFVKVTLTVKNVGDADAEFAGYGSMYWEDEETAAQGATTLEGVGEGPDLDTTYRPGQSVTGFMILDVGRKGGTVGYTGEAGPFSDEPAFTIELPTA
ncbi:DUF4352 domain-containing protein [Streptomyces sp. C10-9-1]|uniref:DUF4352 domain-containing protein n=1 Tax=Streptomyces sp. C10-9-1 TaxID=1859285 RepID=UPI00211249C0|nr:DUF4352 domain-containing protein [Streptomyces sp. C10-9-1]MCQ6554809.1 DUF4352 domain-containing protein [Streptomyces sp. C10-9-1]